MWKNIRLEYVKKVQDVQGLYSFLVKSVVVRLSNVDRWLNVNNLIMR